MMSFLILHTNSGARAALRVERLRRSTALACALNQMYLPDRVLLRFNSRESVDWLMPTIRAISFLGHFLCSKAKICDLCSEVSCLYIRNTKIINLRESSKGDSFFALHYRSSGLRAPAERATRGAFHGLEPMKKRMICCTSILKVREGEEKRRGLSRKVVGFGERVDSFSQTAVEGAASAAPSPRALLALSEFLVFLPSSRVFFDCN